MKLFVCFLAASLLLGAPFPTENERLVAASRLWVTVANFHPYVASGKVDWDSAFVAAVPKIRSATTLDEYSAAIASLLDALHDPCTYVLPQSEAAVAGSGVIISNTPAIIDLRHRPDYSKLLDAPSMEAYFISAPLDAPAQRSVTRIAFESAILTRPGKHFAAGAGNKAGSVFLLGENSRLPEIGAALSAAHEVTVLSESPHFQIAGIETITLDLSGVQAIVRLSEPETQIPVQIVTPSDIESLARLFLGKPRSAQPAASLKVTPAVFDEPYPSAEARILAAAKTWGTIHYFFAYKDLIDEDWDEIFAAYLPKFIAAKDARDYNLTLSDMLTHLTDSNIRVQSQALDAYFGEASVGLRLRMLDKHPVIVGVLDPAASEAGIHPGDIVKHVDGESIVDRFNKQVQYVPSSTPQRSSFDTLQRILNGPAGSKVTLNVESPAGDSKSVTLERSNSYQAAPERTTEPVRLLPGNIGYLDLDRVTKADAETAMRQLHEAKTIIFDLRGKAPAARIIAAHLTSQPETPAAIVTTPLALHPDVATSGIATQTASTFLVETLAGGSLPLFKGKTVALIDERTTGEAEQAGLLFEAANKTEFVGVPSAGANTQVASFTVPGGITVSYSARDIRHANGGKLQRLGLQPNDAAPDTAASIRDGKDSALEAARLYLSR